MRALCFVYLSGRGRQKTVRIQRIKTPHGRAKPRYSSAARSGATRHLDGAHIMRRALTGGIA
eukprot:scaffold85085_cov66-Phaeocystis_antarctica.AAC.1